VLGGPATAFVATEVAAATSDTSATATATPATSSAAATVAERFRQR